MIKLVEEKAFAHGNHREVYRHPKKENRCLKYMNEHWKDSPRYQRAKLIGKIFRPHSYFHESDGELKFSRKTGRKVGGAAWELIACAHGYVESDLGDVLEVDLITNECGEISLTLKEYLWKNGLTPECEKAINVFWEQLDRHWVFVQGRPDNLVIKEKSDGECQIFAIDGYSYSAYIPIAKWVKKEQVRKLAKLRRHHDDYVKDILSMREAGDQDSLGTRGFRVDK